MMLEAEAYNPSTSASSGRHHTSASCSVEAAVPLVDMSTQNQGSEHMSVPATHLASKEASSSYSERRGNGRPLASEQRTLHMATHLPHQNGSHKDAASSSTAGRLTPIPLPRVNGSTTHNVRPPAKPRGSDWYGGMRDMLSTDLPWTEEKEQVVLAPYEYLASKPGKEIRGQLIEALNMWMKVPEEKLQLVHKVVSMLHTSSLLIDDIEDASDLRRGHPSAHHVFGAPQTINSANHVYFLAYNEILTACKDDPAQSLELVRILTEEVTNLHRGQGMELYWRDSFVCPTEEDYVGMVNNKTSGLLRIMVRLMAAQSPICHGKNAQFTEADFTPLVNLVGLLFQIRDDYMNLRSGDYASNKGYCEDLHEGKFSFPMIHALSNSAATGKESKAESAPSSSGTSITDRDGLLAVLRTKPRDPDVKRAAVDYMQHTTCSFRYSCEVMLRLDGLVRQEAENVEAKLAEAEQSESQAQQQSNQRLWGILGALRKGWYGGADCPSL